MQLNPERRLHDLEAATIKADAVSVAQALSSAEAYVLGSGNGAGSTAMDVAIADVESAIKRLTRLREQLETLQWNIESAELEAELVRHGWVQTTTEMWRSPSGETCLSQIDALARLDEQLEQLNV